MRFRAFVAASAALFVLTACGASETAAPAVVTVTETVEAAAATVDPAPEPTPVPSPVESDVETSAPPESDEDVSSDGTCGDATGMCTLGGSYIFVTENGEPFGLSLSVSTPTEYNPSESSAGGDTFDAAVTFEVTIENTGETPYDPSLFYSTLASGGVEGEEIFDSANGLNGSPSTPILPGASITFPVGYGLSDPSDITLQTTIDFDAAPVLWTP